MLNTKTVLAVVVVAMLAGAAGAQVSIGGAQSLYIQPGARPAGMGDCFVAIADDASACFWNPAGLAFMKGDMGFILLHSQLVPDWGDVYYEYAAYAQRIEGLGTIGGSLTYLTYGEQQGTDEEGELTVTFDSYEVIPSLAYGVAIGQSLAAGINLKFIWVDLAPSEATFGQGEGVGTTFGGDVGILYASDRLNLGGAVQHIGPRIAYIDEEQADPLPRNLKVGAAYRLLNDEMNEFTLVAEYEKSLVIYEDFLNQATGVILHGGAEYRYYDLLSFRAGYVHDPDGDVKDFAFGMGLNYKNWAFDFASIPQAEGLKRPFRLSFTGTF
jgi:hypothetical protein